MSQQAPVTTSKFDLLFTGLGLLVIALAVGVTLANVGPGAWLNDLQASLTGGRYFPMLTMLLLGGALAVPLFAVKVLVGRAGARKA